MARFSLWFVPLGCVVAVVFSRSVTAPFAVVIGGLVGLGAMAIIDSRQRKRTRELSRKVNAWMGKVDVDPLVLDGGHDVQELASSLNTLGAAYARRGQRVQAADPMLRSLVQALPDAAMLFDSELTLLVANEDAHDLFSLGEGTPTATQALGSSIFADLVRAAVDSPALHRSEARIGDRTIEAATTPLGDRILFLARDHTTEVAVEAIRRDFIANASHELKSPVAAIQALSDALGIVLEKDPAKARDLNDRVHLEASRLAALVADLLNLRRVDERVVASDLADVTLALEVQDVVERLREAARVRDVTVTVEVDPSHHVRAMAQDVRLSLTNLVDNAIKYNKVGGRVTIASSRVGRDVVLEVGDTGIGIPGKDLGRVFERFHRVDEGRSRAAGGTGLGLSIVRHAVERNGGHVTVRSLLGQGTTFRVTLPAHLEETTDGRAD